VAKRFDQYCPMAHALSIVGERWSLLIVRDLLHGPKRYTDLVKGLPGIGTNILAARLRDLEENGIVLKRKLPQPAASTVYDLTEYGKELDEVMWSLARWGARSFGPPGPDDELYPEWGVNALPALFNPEEARGLTETYVFQIDGDVFTATIRGGALVASVGEDDDADLVVETNMNTFFALASGETTLADATKSGRARVFGDKDARDRCFRVFSLAPRVTIAA
jgi:DNA-binding HxlR family transcriptional regulator